MYASTALPDQPAATAPSVTHPVSALHRTDCNLAHWHRPVPSGISRALANWSRRDAPRFECTVRESRAELNGAFTGLPKGTRAWLASDVRSLLQLFFIVTGSSAVTLKFGSVHSDQCRKFHIDHLRYRLIATYLGPGTEWVPNAYVNRTVLVEPPEDPTRANALIVTDPSAIQRAPVGEILLMKGAQHAHQLGLVHRSPPIEQANLRRVVLTLSTHEQPR